jgi:hypothetical protein
MCTEENWGGTCHNHFFPLGECVSLANPSIFNGLYLFNVGSAGADKGAHCVFFDQK